ncbi:hypothetical protein ACJX0J_021669, partial [Zea mays]
MQHLQDIINLGMMISNDEDDVRSDFHALTAMKIMMLLLSIEGKPNPYHTIIGPQSYVAMLKNAYLYDIFPQIVVRYYILLVTFFSKYELLAVLNNLSEVCLAMNLQLKVYLAVDIGLAMIMIFKNIQFYPIERYISGALEYLILLRVLLGLMGPLCLFTQFCSKQNLLKCFNVIILPHLYEHVQDPCCTGCKPGCLFSYVTTAIRFMFYNYTYNIKELLMVVTFFGYIYTVKRNGKISKPFLYNNAFPNSFVRLSRYYIRSTAFIGSILNLTGAVLNKDIIYPRTQYSQTFSYMYNTKNEAFNGKPKDIASVSMCLGYF